MVKEIPFVMNNTEETKLTFNNDNYSALLPNQNDIGFIKVVFDKHSLDFFSKNLSLIKDSLSRLLIIRALYDMVKDGNTKATDFIDNLISSEFVKVCLGDN